MQPDDYEQQLRRVAADLAVATRISYGEAYWRLQVVLQAYSQPAIPQPPQRWYTRLYWRTWRWKTKLRIRAKWKVGLASFAVKGWWLEMRQRRIEVQRWWLKRKRG